MSFQYIARRLLLNNERKKWTDPADSTSSDNFISQDEEIFKIARLINCAQFRNIVMEDFLTILAGRPPVGPSPNLDILAVCINSLFFHFPQMTYVAGSAELREGCWPSIQRRIHLSFQRSLPFITMIIIVSDISCLAAVYDVRTRSECGSVRGQRDRGTESWPFLHVLQYSYSMKISSTEILAFYGKNPVDRDFNPQRRNVAG